MRARNALRGSRCDCGAAGGRAGTASGLAGSGEAEAADLVTGKLRLAVGAGEVDASAGCTGAGVGRVRVDWVGVGKTGAVAIGGAENSGVENASVAIAGLEGVDGAGADCGGTEVMGVINSGADGSGADAMIVGRGVSTASGEGATVSRTVSGLLSSAIAAGVGFCGAEALNKASLKTEEQWGQ